jgi:hypothetical protein
MKRLIIFAVIFGFVSTAQFAHGSKMEKELTAIDSESFIVGANWASYGDNILRAYSQIAMSIFTVVMETQPLLS